MGAPPLVPPLTARFTEVLTAKKSLEPRKFSVDARTR